MNSGDHIKNTSLHIKLFKENIKKFVNADDIERYGRDQVFRFGAPFSFIRLLMLQSTPTSGLIRKKYDLKFLCPKSDLKILSKIANTY